MTQAGELMTKRSDLLQSISDTVCDYRRDEISPRTPDLINEWVRQFPKGVQVPLLEALDNVLKETYISHDRFHSFLKVLVTTDKLAPGSEPKDYWRSVNFLDIQQGGSSQSEILKMFDEILQETHGFGLASTGSRDGDFIYLDDCIATGHRVRDDVRFWLSGKTPEHIKLNIISPILYKGSWWINGHIHRAAAENDKRINLAKWSLTNFQLENRLSSRNQADVLWPTEIPDTEHVKEYCAFLEEMGHPPETRGPGNPGASRIFANDAQKILLENQFLIRGCLIRSEQHNLPQSIRPLGYSNLHTLGFGSMFVTYRNCPNNCPLVFWVEQDEFPALFPRKTNI